MLPNTTCRPSKKFSPMTMTIAPPVVQPSLGLMALIHGVAAQKSNASVTPRVSIQEVQQLKVAMCHIAGVKANIVEDRGSTEKGKVRRVCGEKENARQGPLVLKDGRGSGAGVSPAGFTPATLAPAHPAS
ncbi:hypothetical protein EYF80_037351 [Liparis tanakae]|uniref:Uncharacterized protein n=1 Tax=Liparis tanakae TaxID=230148 RepID=A0A4Z2GGU5_9TELE|nr:hypothetical protein EYF80_037351 [Liparis tanakae]